jgi:hypothetical protein
MIDNVSPVRGAPVRFTVETKAELFTKPIDSPLPVLEEVKLVAWPGDVVIVISEPLAEATTPILLMLLLIALARLLAMVAALLPDEAE